MKLAIVLLAALGCVAAASFEQYALKDDLAKLRALIPLDKIKAVVEKYKQSGDQDLAELDAYFRSEEFESLKKKVAAMPAIQKAISDLEAQGINVKDLINVIAAAVGWPVLPMKANPAAAYAWRDMAKEIKALIPTDELLVTAVKLLQTSPDFQNLYKRASSPESRAVAQEIVQIPEMKALLEKMRGKGLDVDKVAQRIKDILGWK